MKASMVFLALGLVVFAQDPEANSAVLTGEVLADAGTFLPGTKVSLIPDIEGLVAQGRPLGTGKSVVTDSQGKFVMNGVPAGTYNLSADRAGYVRQPYGAKPGQRTGTSIVVQSGVTISNLRIRMTPHSAISGRVRNKNGEFVSSVAVHAVRWSFAGGVRQLLEEGKSSSSDAGGGFRISDLPPGKYFVYAVPKSEIRRFDKIERKVLPTFYPNSLVVADAIPVDIISGSDGFADVQLREDAQFTIRGTVLGQEEMPPSGATVLVLDDADAPVLQRASGSGAPPPSPPYVAIARTDTQGHFELSGVVPGFHRVFAFAGNRVPLNFGSRGSVTLNGTPSPEDGGGGSADVRISDGDVSDVKIQLLPGSEITRKISLEGSTFDEWQGALLGKNGTPPEQAQKMKSQMAGFVPPVTLVPEQRVSVGGRFPDSPRAGGPTQKISPGRYYLSITGTPQLYLKALRIGGEDVTMKALIFTAGTADLEVIMAQDGGQVSGSLKDSDGNPLGGRIASLWPVETDLSQLNGGAKVATSSNDGSFVFYNLAPGRYYLVAFEELPDSGLGQYMPFLAQFAAGTEYLKVEASNTVSGTAKMVSRKDVEKAIAGLP